MNELSPRTVLVHPDAEALAAAVAARLISTLIDIQSVKTPIHLVLTGGTVGIATLAQVAASPAAAAVDWSGVHVWWGDERFLPAGDPDRNATQAEEALLNQLAEALPAQNIHVAPPLSDTVRDPEAAATIYAEQLAAFAKPGLPAPEFDILLLGMGPDGHVASLFPGFEQLAVISESVVGVEDSPKPPPQRVTFTIPTIQAAREVWVIAAGAEKAPAVARALNSDPDTPASAALGREKSLWLLDAAAATEAYSL